MNASDKPFDQPLCDWLIRQAKCKHGVFYFGICGAQGSGKSTLALKLKKVLAERGLNCSVLSLDDLYLSKARRQDLARKVHPLLATRGAPGTHDIEQGLALFDALDHWQDGDHLALPRFDKAADDTAEQASWPLINKRPNVLIFEGWCVGLGPQTEDELKPAANSLELERDTDGRWRRWVNQQLSSSYQTLFNRLDKLLFLEIPDWNSVLRWRVQQEQQTAALALASREGIMTTQAIADFIQHYQRLSLHALDSLPKRADVLRRLGPDHQILEQLIRKP